MMAGKQTIGERSPLSELKTVNDFQPQSPTRRKSRRSWFENSPSVKLEIACAPNKRRRSSGIDGEIETLILSHFTNPPRIGFGKLKPGHTRSRRLRIKNPHDYEQHVTIERFPFKKDFTIDETEFVVPAHDVVMLTITWSPESEGSFREMMMFLIDGAYRLTAFVFGTMENPQQKKRSQRKGLLGSKAQHQVSVIHTKSLSSIKESYKTRNGGKRKSPPGKVITQKPLIPKERKYCDEDIENEDPTDGNGFVYSKGGHRGDTVPDTASASDTAIRRSATYDKISEMTSTPFPSKSTATGRLEISGAFSPVIGDFNRLSRELALDENYSFSDPDRTSLTEHHTFEAGENSTNDAINKNTAKVTANSLKSMDAVDMINQNPTLIIDSNQSEDVKSTSIRSHLSPHQTIVPVPASNANKYFVSPNSFLHDSLHRVSMQDKSVGTEEDSFVELKRNTKHMPGRKVLSPETFLRGSMSFSVGNASCNSTDTIPSPHSILNSSVPHDIMVKHLGKMRNSLSNTNSPNEKSVCSSQRQRDNRFREIPDVSSPRRTTYNVPKGKSKKIPVSRKIPQKGKRRSLSKLERREEQISSKRETFLISKHKQGPKKSKKSLEREQPKSDHRPVVDSLTVSKEKPFADHRPRVDSQTVSKDKPSAEQTAHINLKTVSEKKRNSGKRLFFPISTEENSEPRLNFIANDSSIVPSEIHSHDFKIPVMSSSCINIPDFSISKIEANSTSSLSRTNLSPGRGMSPMMNCTFGMPQALPTSPTCMVSKRATLTVTKRRPSEVLFYSMAEITKQHEVQDDSFIGCHGDITGVGPVLEGSGSFEVRLNEDDESGISNSKVENADSLDCVYRRSDDFRRQIEADSILIRYAEDSEEHQHSEQFSSADHQLLASPILNNSRRSTHVVCPAPVDIFVPLEAEGAGINQGIKPSECTVLPETDYADHSLADARKADADQELSAGFCGTPQMLPSSPHLDHSRRSTHVISKPKVIDLGELEPKTLFVSLSVPEEASKVTDAQCRLAGRKPSTAVSVVQERLLKKNAHSKELTASSSTIQKKAKLGKNEVQAKMVERRKVTAKTSVKPRNGAKGLAPGKLLLVKKMQKAFPKHPLPFAAKNMYYDERWADKQERGFSQWLNFILTPPDEYRVVDNLQTKVDARALSLDVATSEPQLAPSKEVISFRAYAARGRMNRLRRASCRLFQSESVVQIIQKLEAEVEGMRLYVRKDRRLNADIGIKQRILDMILSYNPLWLRIGLETIYGELIAVQSNSDVVGLSRFILSRLLGNPDIALEYAHPTVPHLYRDGYAEAVSKHTLKKFLLLVYYLDVAKTRRLIDHDPCLFCKDSDYKNSRDLLLHFSRDYLCGEGDITRHLGYFGFKVTHVQTALEEFDFAVSNIAIDLKDGIRLTRVIETMMGKRSLSPSLRVPAISRLQKIFNVGIVIKALSVKDIHVDAKDGGDIQARDVVDGHREKTLALLWRIIFNFQVEQLINAEQLKEEISRLKRNLHVRSRLDKLLNNKGVDTLGLPRGRRASMEPDLYFKSEKLQLLLSWCEAVCAYYRLQVENFTVSFADGRAFCFIIHHYHPALLPLDAIKVETTQTHLARMEKDGDPDINDSFGDFWGSHKLDGTEESSVYDKLLSNERDNFRLLHEKVSEIGGVPMMVKAADMSSTIPDEKVVITYTSYLCARLLDICNESQAARVIQAAWRNHRLATVQRLNQEKKKAAVVLQRAARTYLKQHRLRKAVAATVKIQAIWRGYLARKHTSQLRDELESKLQMSAAIKIQALWRGFGRRLHLRQEQAATITVQAHVRGFIQRNKYLCQKRAVETIEKYCISRNERKKALAKINERHNAVITIQMHLRGHIARTRVTKLKAAIKIQAEWRRYSAAKKHERQVHSAIVVQSYWRMHRQRASFDRLTMSAIVIQRRLRAFRRMCAERQRYLELKLATICLQKYIRGSQQRRLHLKVVSAAICLQSCFRGYKKCIKYKAMKLAAIIIQRRFQTYQQACVERREFLQWRRASICLQKNIRMLQERRRYLKLKASVVILQSRFRGYKTRVKYQALRLATLIIQMQFRAQRAMLTEHKKYVQMKKAALTLQRFIRGSQQRRRFARIKYAVLTLQRHFHGCKARTEYQAKLHAVYTIQSRYRAYKAKQIKHREYCCMKSAVLLLQRGWRAYVQRREQKRNLAAVKIQATFKGYVIRIDYLKKRASVIKIQALMRGLLQYRQYKKTAKAIATLQSHARAYILKKKAVGEFREVKSAVKIIQRSWKSKRIRQKYVSLRRAVVTLQARFRGQRQRREYIELRSATVCLQRRYRSLLQGRHDFYHFQVMKGAAITIQASWKGLIVRRNYAVLLKKVIMLQSNVRRYQARNRYVQIKEATRQILNYLRCCLQRRECMRKYNEIKGAAVTLQAAYRGWACRRSLRHQTQAVITLQTAARRHQAQRAYRHQRAAAVVIQQWWRRHQEMQRQVVAYRATRHTIVAFQSAVRGLIQRRNYLHTRNAIVKIQAAVKSWLQEREYRHLRSAAIVMQRWFRNRLLSRQVRSSFLSTKKSVVLIQSAFRRRAERRRFINMRRAVVLMQSIVRGYLQRRRIQKLDQAVRVIQCRHRANMLMAQEKQKYQKTRHCALLIQDAYRCYRRRAVCRQEKAAIKLQSWTRMQLARSRFCLLKAAVIKLQACERRRIVQQQYVTLRCATIQIQQKWRATLIARQCHYRYTVQIGACITIQSLYKMYVARCHYLKMRQHTIQLQSAVRCFQQRCRYLNTRYAACFIQKWFRRVIQGRRDRDEFRRRRASVISLQAATRGYLVRKSRRRNHAAVTIQSSYKAYQQRKEFLSILQSVVRLQTWTRECLTRRKVDREMIAINTIQTWYRRTKLMHRQRVHYQTVRQAAIMIQSLFRRQRYRQQMNREKAVIKIQSYYKMHRQRHVYRTHLMLVVQMQSTVRRWLARRRYTKYQAAIVCIQARFRGLIEGRRVRKALVVAKTSAVKIQALYRGYIARREMKRANAAILIQAAFRGHRERLQYVTVLGQITLLQANVRRYLARRRVYALRRKHRAAKCIQIFYREYRASQYTKKQAELRAAYVQRFSQAALYHLSASKIQICYRKHQLLNLARQRLSSVFIIQRWTRFILARLRFLRMQRSVHLLQVAYRRWCFRRHAATTVIQRCARRWLAKQRTGRLHRAALAIQSVWRGRQVRKRTASKRMSLIRQRVEAANRSATEENKLCNRTASALDYLLSCKHLAYILEALMHLDVATRLSPRCCERMQEVNAVGVIFRLIRSCNRSVPHMELIKYCINVLLNLSKYKKTAGAVYGVEDSIESLVELLQIYREKGTIFMKTCQLVGILAIDVNRNEEICSQSVLLEKVRSIHLLTLRKSKMDKSRRVTMAKLAASKSFSGMTSFSVPPKKQHKVHPEWNLNRDKMEEIDDPMKAICFVMNVLHLTPK